MQSPLDEIAKMLNGPPIMGYESGWLQRALCYTPKFKKSEMTCDWQEGRPPDLVFCEVFHRGQVVPGVNEGWTFFSMRKGAHPLSNRTLDSGSITAWRISETEPA